MLAGIHLPTSRSRPRLFSQTLVAAHQEREECWSGLHGRAPTLIRGRSRGSMPGSAAMQCSSDKIVQAVGCPPALITLAANARGTTLIVWSWVRLPPASFRSRSSAVEQTKRFSIFLSPRTFTQANAAGSATNADGTTSSNHDRGRGFKSRQPHHLMEL